MTVRQILFAILVFGLPRLGNVDSTQLVKIIKEIKENINED